MSAFKIDGASLRRKRQEQLLSQQDLGQLAGLSMFTISRLESGRRVATTAKTIKALAAALGCHPFDFSELVEESA